jgi:hypothetical protein
MYGMNSLALTSCETESTGARNAHFRANAFTDIWLARYQTSVSYGKDIYTNARH